MPFNLLKSAKSTPVIWTTYKKKFAIKCYQKYNWVQFQWKSFMRKLLNSDRRCAKNIALTKSYLQDACEQWPISDTVSYCWGYCPLISHERLCTYIILCMKYEEYVRLVRHHIRIHKGNEKHVNSQYKIDVSWKIK